MSMNRTNQSAKKPISDRISIFEQKQQQQQAPSSLPNRGQNLVTKKTVSAGKNFSAIKSQFDAGKTPTPVPEKPTEKGAEPENGSTSPSIASPDNSRPASTVSTSRKNSTARKNSAGSASESTITTASSSPPPSAKSSVSSVTSTASKTVPRVAKNLTSPGNSRTPVPAKTNKVIGTEKIGSSKSSAPPTASAKSSVASVAESNAAPSSARAPRASVVPATATASRAPVKQPVAPKRSSSPANKLQRTQSTVKTNSAPTKVATASKTAPIPAPVTSAPKKIVAAAPVKQNGVKAPLGSSLPASSAPNKPILNPSKGKATVPPASQQPLKSALKKTPTVPKEIDIPEVPSTDKVSPVEESLPPASSNEVSKKNSIGAEPRKKSIEHKEPIVVTNKKSVKEPAPPLVVNQAQQVKPEPVNLKSKKVSASGFKSEPDNKVVKKNSVSSVKDQKKVSVVNKKSVTEVQPVTSPRKDSGTILVKEPEQKIEEEEKISPPTSVISLESIGKVETTSSATVALLIITDDKPANHLGQTSLPDNSLSKNFVAETCLNVSAVDIEELEDQEESEVPATRESKLSELSYSVASSVEDLHQERQRNYSVSSSGSDQSTDDYPTSTSVRPEVPTVTVTLEEPESKPAATPIILIENNVSEKIFEKSSVLRPKTSESELNLKNMSTDSLNDIPGSGLVRSSYWTNQALQNDNAQKINEVKNVFFNKGSFIFDVIYFINPHVSQDMLLSFAGYQSFPHFKNYVTSFVDNHLA